MNAMKWSALNFCSSSISGMTGSKYEKKNCNSYSPLSLLMCCCSVVLLRKSQNPSEDIWLSLQTWKLNQDGARDACSVAGDLGMIKHSHTPSSCIPCDKSLTQRADEVLDQSVHVPIISYSDCVAFRYWELFLISSAIIIMLSDCLVLSTCLQRLSTNPQKNRETSERAL